MAVLNSKLNLAFHKVDGVKVYRSDLFENVDSKFDLILFHAPRSIETPQGVIAEPGDEIRFDLGGGINQRFLAEFPMYLNPGGSALIMTNSDTQFGPNLKSEMKAQGRWNPTLAAGGSFAIFSLQPH